MSEPEKSPENKQNSGKLLLFLGSVSQYLVILFCFILFPLFILHTSLTRLYELKTGILRAKTFLDLTQQIERLDTLSSNRTYFHHLLKKIFVFAQEHKDPKEYLGRNIANLKKLYGNSIEFIVWDENGKIVKQLTDQKGYKFILNKLYESLKETSDILAEDTSVGVSEIPAISKNKNLIGKFLGRFFIPEQLKLPYLMGREAGPIKVDFSVQRSDYWYQIGPRISFLVFFSNNVLDGSSCLEKLIRQMKHSPGSPIVGFVKAPDISNLPDVVPFDLRNELTMALARFENFSQPIIESEKTIIAINVSGKNLRLFSMLRKKPEQWSVPDLTNAALVKILSMIGMVYLLIYFAVAYLKVFVSIKLKLTSVFLFANLIPLIVLGFIGYDYLESKSISLENAFINSSFENLRKFDARFGILKDELRKKLNKVCDAVNLRSKGLIVANHELENLKEAIQKANPEECYLVSSASEKIYEYFKNSDRPTHSNSFVVPMIAASLQFINGQPIRAEKNDLFKALLSPDNSELVRNAQKNSGSVFEVNTGNKFKTGYQYVFGIPGETPFHYCLIMVWEHAALHQYYVDKYFSRLVGTLRNSKPFIRSANGTKFWPSKEQCPRQIREFLEKAETSLKNVSARIFLDGKPHIAVGMKGRYLNTVVLANVIPEAALKEKISGQKIYIWLALALNFLLIVAISLFLARQFMKPIHELERATIAIGRKDFKHRIPQSDNDELGYLGTVFNRVTEGLGDLDVARIVQESLFPGNSFKAGEFGIFGKSVVMTTLGGDYYDCFAIDQHRWAIVIGDVAGHGVAAGLMMAMAKAGVLTASDKQKADPSELTRSLHRIFFSIKSPKMKRMMTFQYFILEHQTGNLTFANAGHCFPLIVDPETRTGEFIEHVATPLGIGPRSRCKNYSFVLKPGQALILYTDGIAEAKNKEGKEFGWENLSKVLPQLYDPDPEIYYRRIFAMYESWSAQPDDDLTIIVVVRGKTDI
ncbi:MAG: hypothetical protein Kow0029_19700 [Candidatus Rifleibacteriota bacterium]